jgi:signal peptidase II
VSNVRSVSPDGADLTPATPRPTDPPGPQHRAPWWLPILIVGAVVALDQLTKTWAVRRLARGPVVIVSDSVDLRVARNPGSAFGLVGNTGLLVLLAAGITVALIFALRDSDSRGMTVGLSFVLGGAFGNLCDRFFRAPGFPKGAVVDFVRVGAWPSFNLADSAITIGAVLIIFFGWRRAD